MATKKVKQTTSPHTHRAIEVIARGLLVRAGHVLLCRAAKGYSYLPGGHVEHGESAAAALRREFLEECRLPVTVGPLALISEGAFTAGRKATLHHELLLVFHVEPSRPPAKPRSRTSPRANPDLPDVRSVEPEIDFHWVPLPVVQDLDVRPEVHRAWLSTLGRAGTIERPPPPEWLSAFSDSGDRPR